MMNHNIYIKLTVSVVAYLIVACGTAERLYERISVSDELLQRIDGTRDKIDVESIGRVEPLFSLERPPDANWPYRMSSPTALAAVGSPICRIVVADPIDQALHMFDFRGKYERSIALHVKAVRQMSTVAALRADSRNGMIDAYDASKAGVVRIRFDGPELRIERRSVSEDYVEDLSRKVVLSEALNGRKPVGLGAYEFVVPNDDQLSEALNQGQLVVEGDTLWFARFLDGRIFKFVKTSEGELALESVLTLPVYFSIDRPEHIRVEGPGEIPIRVQRHLLAFSVHIDGSFVFSQTVDPYVRWALTIMQRETGQTARLLVGRVLALATVEDLIITLESADSPGSWSMRRRVSAYLNPLGANGLCRETTT